jgi:hypothetical protein
MSKPESKGRGRIRITLIRRLGFVIRFDRSIEERQTFESAWTTDSEGATYNNERRAGKIELSQTTLQHLEVRPGDEIHVDILPNGNVRLQGAQKKRSTSRFFGSFYRENGPRLTIEQMNEVIAQGWAGEI